MVACEGSRRESLNNDQGGLTTGSYGHKPRSAKNKKSAKDHPDPKQAIQEGR